MDAFEERDASGRVPTREQWLRKVFASPIEFEHWKERFHYVPTPGVDATIIAGRIGRQISVQENEPPEAGLSDTSRESWRAAVILLDPRHHEDGQKVAAEHEPRVGNPRPIFESLALHLNLRDPPSPYVIEVRAISPADNFWTFVDQNPGQITSVTFELVAPNMFGSEEEFDAELRDMQKNERIRRIKLQLENLQDGLELHTDRVRSAINYASRGGGSVRARTKSNKKFNSKEKAQRIQVEEGGIEEIVDLLKIAVHDIFKL